MAYTPVVAPITLTTSAFNSSTGVLNWDMLSNTASGWYDTQNMFPWFTCDIYTTTTVTGGVLTFEQTNDTTNDSSGTTVNLQDATVITQTNVTTLTLVASTVKHYHAAITSRYVRFRFSTAFAGTGTVGATVQFRTSSYAPLTLSVNQATAGSLATTATIASGTVTTVSTVTAVTAVNAMNSVATTNGLSLGTVVTAATPAVNTIKNTAGRLHHMTVSNPNASAVYLKIFNATTATLGTTSATLNYLVPATSATPIYIGDQGLYFSAGILTAVTGAISLTDDTSISAGCAVSYSWI